MRLVLSENLGSMNSMHEILYIYIYIYIYIHICVYVCVLNVITDEMMLMWIMLL